MKIHQITPYNITNNNYKSTTNPIKKEEYNYNSRHMLNGYNDYLLFFGARVDKGLKRFYDTNKDRMPDTVKNYIDGLENRENITPLEAQQKAFSKLEYAKTTDDIKNAYPDEELFKRLIEPENTRATQGILYSIRENKELMDLMDQPALKNGESLTVYLVKKIFLENKTMAEINKDLDTDLDTDLKADFRIKNKDSKYIHNGTLNALGIKAPDFEYRTSLRYTKDGYSDMIGEKISEAQRLFWESMPPEERTARAKKSVRKFENWWASIPRKKKLEMIVDQTNELDMLKKFNAENPQKTKNTNTAVKTEHNTAATKTKVGSEQLSRDDLFKIWAKNNLKLYIENLSESDRQAIQVIKTERMLSRWQEMSPAEKTAYIEKIKSGLEPLKFTMIDAWNNSFDIIKDLSLHLIENQIYKPAELLYSTDAFSDFQSRVMSEFWESHPEYARQLGDNIIKSRQKVQKAIDSGHFEELKKEIGRQKTRRIKELALLKHRSNNSANITLPQKEPQYMKDFKNAYYKALNSNMKNLPQAYINEYFNIINNNFSKEHIEAWTKNLTGKYLTDDDKILLNEIKKNEPREAAFINRALEATLANILYECTKQPMMYSLSFSDLKVALAQVDRGQREIDVYSYTLNKEIKMPILRYKFDKNKINSLYNTYIKSLPDEELEYMAKRYFTSESGDYKDLIEYLKTYGSSLNIVFSSKSQYPANIQGAMIDRIIHNMPNNIYNNYKCTIFKDKELEKEIIFRQSEMANRRLYHFVPAEFLDDYYKAANYTAGKMENDMLNIGDYNSKGYHFIRKFDLDNATKLKTLAMEQVLADMIYNISNNPIIYSLDFEDIGGVLNTIQAEKRFPATIHYMSPLKGEISLRINKRPLISKTIISNNYHNYLNEINERISDTETEWNRESLLYALNPKEDKPDIDDATLERINWVEPDFER